jgi:hypothetical protein
MKKYVLAFFLTFACPGVTQSFDQTWVCIGDSHTARKGFADVVCDIKVGMIGTTAAWWLNIYSGPFPSGDGVVVLLGTNDASFSINGDVYKQTMQDLANRLLTEGGYKRILFITAPLTNHLTQNIFLNVYAPRLLDLCDEMPQVRCADFRSVMVPRGDYLADNQHFNNAGDSLLTKTILHSRRPE